MVIPELTVPSAADSVPLLIPTDPEEIAEYGISKKVHPPGVLYLFKTLDKQLKPGTQHFAFPICKSQGYSIPFSFDAPPANTPCLCLVGLARWWTSKSLKELLSDHDDADVFLTKEFHNGALDSRYSANNAKHYVYGLISGWDQDAEDREEMLERMLSHQRHLPDSQKAAYGWGLRHGVEAKKLIEAAGIPVFEAGDDVGPSPYEDSEEAEPE